jgi:hypothetical protein
LIPYITAGLTRIFGDSGKGPIAPAVDANGNPLVVGGAQVFNVPNITPTSDFETDVPKIPGFGPGHNQVYFPVPDKPTGGVYGAGNVVHVEFDTVENSAGQVTSITGVTAHFDIANPYKGHGAVAPWHLAMDFGLARASQRACGGGPVKFQ